MKIFLKILFIFLFVSSLFSESQEIEESFVFDKLRIIKNPNSNPESINSELIPPTAKILFVSDFVQEKFLSVEVFLILHSTMTTNDLSQYYEILFKLRSYKILQQESMENKTMYLIENQNRRLITIHIDDKNSYRKIKLYLKSSNY